MINKEKIKHFLNNWGTYIVEIGKLNGDAHKQKQLAEKIIKKFYGYPVLKYYLLLQKLKKNHFAILLTEHYHIL